MARRECCHEIEMAILPHALIYPFRIFKLGKFALDLHSTIHNKNMKAEHLDLH